MKSDQILYNNQGLLFILCTTNARAEVLTPKKHKTKFSSLFICASHPQLIAPKTPPHVIWLEMWYPQRQDDIQLTTTNTIHQATLKWTVLNISLHQFFFKKKKNKSLYVVVHLPKAQQHFICLNDVVNDLPLSLANAQDRKIDCFTRASSLGWTRQYTYTPHNFHQPCLVHKHANLLVELIQLIKKSLILISNAAITTLFSNGFA